MKIAQMNWMQVEDRVKTNDCCILPIGSVEQHAYLSLCTDMILAERIAQEAAAPLGVPVFPVMPYGMVPGFAAYPGTLSLTLTTYAAVMRDLLDSLYGSGFRRIVIVNGHGGNTPVSAMFPEWMNEKKDVSVKLHDWWRAPKTWAKVMATDPQASHASWMENFPWTRLDGVAMPDDLKPCVDFDYLARSNASNKRAHLGDGNYHGLYQRPDDDMLAIWAVAVEETRTVIAEGWN